jgi:hypothetical protein
MEAQIVSQRIPTVRMWPVVPPAGPAGSLGSNPLLAKGPLSAEKPVQPPVALAQVTPKSGMDGSATEVPQPLAEQKPFSYFGYHGDFRLWGKMPTADSPEGIRAAEIGKTFAEAEAACAAYEKAIASAPSRSDQPNADPAAVAASARLFVNRMLEICNYWYMPPQFFSNVATDAAGNPIKLQVTEGQVTEGTVTIAVGDVHGDLNPLLMNLILSGVAEFEPVAPRMTFYDTVNKCRVAPGHIDRNDLARYRLIPNLRLRAESDTKGTQFQLVFLGDIGGRGAFTDECWCLILALLSDCDGWQARPIRIVCGDHDLHGIVGTCVSPTYDGTRHMAPPAIFDEQVVGSLIRHAILKGWMTYAHVAPNGILYSHSFFTREFLGLCIEQLSRIDEQSNEFREVMACSEPSRVIAQLTFLRDYNPPVGAASDTDYREAVRIVTGYFNDCLGRAAEVREGVVQEHSDTRRDTEKALMKLPIFDHGDESLEGKVASPMFSRLASPVVPMQGQVVGHTNLSGHLPRMAGDVDREIAAQYAEMAAAGEYAPYSPSVGANANILMADLQVSYWYAFLDARTGPATSFPRIMSVQPDGTVRVARIAIEEHVRAFMFPDLWDSTGAKPPLWTDIRKAAH